MQRTMTPTFGTTAVRLWPADPGELPEVATYDLRVERPGVVGWNGFLEMAEVPLDFVLREPLELPDDLDDFSVLAFMLVWGPLTESGGRALDQLPATERQGVPRSRDHWSLAVQRHHLRVLRAVARHWIASRSGGDVRAAWTAEGWNTPKSETMAWDWWADYLNAAMAGFHMHVEVEVDDRKLRGMNLVGGPTIYAVAMRQLAQLASAGELIRHCANDRCGRPFTRQRGRSQYGQEHATGVLYCSRECARAQAERKRRARRAAERKAAQA